MPIQAHEGGLLPDIEYPVSAAAEDGDCRKYSEGKPLVQFKSFTEEHRFVTSNPLSHFSDCSTPKSPKSGRVEVFSKSSATWCAGFVEKFIGKEVVVSFQLPGAGSAEWAKKQLDVEHEELRWLKDGRVDGAPTVTFAPISQNRSLSSSVSVCQDTSLPSNWSAEELVSYDEVFEDAILSHSELNFEKLSDLLQGSQLPQRVLDEILQVANPELKLEPSIEEFRACCRLVAHCQVLAKHDKLVIARGAKFRAKLRAECMREPAQEVATFDREAVGVLGGESGNPCQD